MSNINLIRNKHTNQSSQTADEPIMIYLIAREHDGNRWYLKQADHDNDQAMYWTQDIYRAFYMYTQAAMEACIHAYPALSKRKDIFIVNHETTISNLYTG